MVGFFAMFSDVLFNLEVCLTNGTKPTLVCVVIHVEKTFKAVQCQMRGKYYKNKQGITKHMKTKQKSTHTKMASSFKVSRSQTYFIKI